MDFPDLFKLGVVQPVPLCSVNPVHRQLGSKVKVLGEDTAWVIPCSSHQEAWVVGRVVVPLLMKVSWDKFVTTESPPCMFPPFLISTYSGGRVFITAQISYPPTPFTHWF